MTQKPERFFSKRLEILDNSWNMTVLPNELKTLHIPTPTNDHFYLGALIRTGTRNDPVKCQGVSHFLEHMMFRGSTNFPKFTKLAEAFEWLGGEWNAETGLEHTEYWYAGIRHTSRQIIDLFFEFLQNPLFLDIEVERQIVKREIEGDLNELGYSTDIDLHLAELFWPDCSMSRPITGTLNSIENIHKRELKAYRNKFYTPANMIIIAVGGDEADFRHVQQRFRNYVVASSTPRTVYPPAPRSRGTRIKWVENSDNEYDVAVSFGCEGEWSIKGSIYELVARILADGFCSRLSSKIREELGLVYDIDTDTSLHIESGTIDITAAVGPEQVEKFLSHLFQELRQLRDDGPSPDETDRAILRSVVDLEFTVWTPEDFASRVAWGHLCGTRYSLIEERSAITNVKPKDVQRICQELFQPDNLGIVAIGPATHRITERIQAIVESELPPG